MMRPLAGGTAKTYWFTGLSGSGKSTIAQRLEKQLFENGVLCYVLDGDNIRHGLNKDLSFSPEDRTENIRRVAETAKLLNDAGVTVITSFISPYRVDRGMAKSIINGEPAGTESTPDDDGSIKTQRFIEVFIDTPVDECEKRDPKGLYKKARAGELADFTGVSAPYEAPEQADIILDTLGKGPDLLAQEVISYTKA